MTTLEMGKCLSALSLVDPLLPGVFSHHRTVLAAALCLEKGQRGHLVVEQHESCPGASWSPTANLGFPSSHCMVRPAVTNLQALLWIFPQQMPTGRLSSHEYFLQGTFGSHSGSHPPGWVTMLNQVCCGFVQQKFEPPSRMEFLPIPLVICSRAAQCPHDEVFPTSQATICDIGPTTKESLALPSFPLPFKRLVATVTFTSWSCQYYVAGTKDVTLHKGVTRRILLEGCEHSWHLFAKVASICKQAT